MFPPDSELLSAFRRGVRDALEQMYRFHVRSVERQLRALARRTGNPELTQASVIADLLQEVFARAFSTQARSSYDGVRDYAVYLSAITRNCFVDLLRTRGKEVLTDTNDLVFDVGVVPEPEDWLDPRLASVLATYVAELQPRLRDVYEQRFLHGSSQEEACTNLGMSRRSLRTAEQHLRRGLRKALVRAGISLDELRAPERPIPTLIAARAASGGASE